MDRPSSTHTLGTTDQDKRHELKVTSGQNLGGRISLSPGPAAVTTMVLCHHVPGRVQVFHFSESSIRLLLLSSHGVELLLSVLLGLVRDVGVVKGSLVAASTGKGLVSGWLVRKGKNIHVVGVLVAVVRAGGRLEVAGLEDLARVLLGLLRGVGVVEISLVATSDVSGVGHVD